MGVKKLFQIKGNVGMGVIGSHLMSYVLAATMGRPYDPHSYVPLLYFTPTSLHILVGVN